MSDIKVTENDFKAYRRAFYSIMNFCMDRHYLVPYIAEITGMQIEIVGEIYDNYDEYLTLYPRLDWVDDLCSIDSPRDFMKIIGCLILGFAIAFALIFGLVKILN